MIKFPIMLKGYAIYNPETDLYSKGGTGPQWGKHPKIWEIGPLKNHLYLFITEDYRNRTLRIRNPYIGCKLIDVSTGEETVEFNIEDLLTGATKRHRWHGQTDFRVEWI